RDAAAAHACAAERGHQQRAASRIAVEALHGALGPAAARAGRKPRSARGRRKMKLLLVFRGAVAAVGLFLLAPPSADTTLFAQQYPLLLALNAALATLLAGVVAFQLLALARRYRARVFGAR